MRRHHRTPFIDLRRRELLLALSGTFVAAQAPAQSLLSGGERRPLPNCTVTPEQTEGPYFIDTRLDRSDLRTDFSDKSAKPGVPLILQLRVHAVRNDTCTPLAGAIVDVWHCDAGGVYSGIETKNSSFLRGYQTTDNNGKVQFQTIYPGRYPGRTVHIHFKVRARNRTGIAHEFTSQLYFDDAVTARVHQHPAYAGQRGTAVSNTRDGLFRHGGPGLMLTLRQAGDAYVATFDIGLRLT